MARQNGDRAVVVEDLVKHFRVHRREAGVAAGVKSLLRRKYADVRAVAGVSFSIDRGEMVGFLGPNGAGKTTTLKCLSGLLYPTSGRATVMGFTPHERKTDFLRSFTLVMGQRNQLFWDLPAMETFLVNQAIYRIPPAEFGNTLTELVDLLGLGPYLDKPVRNLSLGERMRAELAAALLHRPAVLFLDEPTLGLDVTGAAAVRSFLADYNVRTGATVLLTSHYMIDVTALTRRVIVIDQGQIRFDGDLQVLADKTAPHRVIKVTLSSAVARADLAGYGEVEATDGLTAVLRVSRTHTKDVAARLLAELPVEDIAIEDPPIEEVIRQVFAQE
ncbi:MAG TPA: ATP-binding cassette domain-containing protein [Acidimicrobiia bacterium]|nr:ATP-binding cassette domain-containing protein [Acidimicrobiia bacterium]